MILQELEDLLEEGKKRVNMWDKDRVNLFFVYYIDEIGGIIMDELGLSPQEAHLLPKDTEIPEKCVLLILEMKKRFSL